MDIEDGNKLIAEFMELPFKNGMYWRKEIVGYDAGATLGYTVDGLCYHEDWNWLMEVVVKILYSDWDKKRSDIANKVSRKLTFANIDIAWKEVIEFIHTIR